METNRLSRQEENAMTAVTELGYVVFGVSDLAAWRDFATNLIGLEVF
jgi:hypothetical protein